MVFFGWERNAFWISILLRGLTQIGSYLFLKIKRTEFGVFFFKSKGQDMDEKGIQNHVTRTYFSNAQPTNKRLFVESGHGI